MKTQNENNTNCGEKGSFSREIPFLSSSDIKRIREILPDHVSGKRLVHTYGVERESLSLASVFGFSEEDTLRLQAAALLHDITKQLTPEEHRALCEKYALPCGEIERRSPKLYHAVTGAAVAEDLFPQICTGVLTDALRRHTLGHPEMTLFEALLYLADYIEPTRTFEDCVRLRRFFYGGLHDPEARISASPAEKTKFSPYTPVTSLDPSDALSSLLLKTLIYSYDLTIGCLMADGSPIHPTTVSARNALINVFPAEE